MEKNSDDEGLAGAALVEFTNALALARLKLTEAEREALFSGYCHFKTMNHRTIKNPVMQTKDTDILRRLLKQEIRE